MVTNIEKSAERIFVFFFDHVLRKKIERIFLIAGIMGFIIHILLISLHHLDVFNSGIFGGKLFASPIAALYTPFSFILVYEAYLLIYYLHKSFTTSIGKQFEIISLLVIRGIFKDISNLDINQHLIYYPKNLNLIADITGFMILFFLIFLFYKLKNNCKPIKEVPGKTDRFIFYKKAISIVLVPILILAACISLTNWVSIFINNPEAALNELSIINQVFYHDFFTILILADVLILIISFRYTERYSHLIRNSGFIISTILIRISFSCEGVLKISMIVVSLLFGVIILKIHNMLIETEIQPDTMDENATIKAIE